MPHCCPIGGNFQRRTSGHVTAPYDFTGAGADNFKTCNDPGWQGEFDTFKRSNLTLAVRERDGIDIHG